MRADVCDPKDDAAVARFREALRRLGARNDGTHGALGVEVHLVTLDGETLTVFVDAWSLDIEGSEALVRRVMQEYARPAG